MTDQDRAELNVLDTEPEGEDTMLRSAIERMPALLGPEDGADSRDGGKGAQLILVQTPTKAWSTEDLKDFAGTIQGCLNDGDDLERRGDQCRVVPPRIGAELRPHPRDPPEMSDDCRFADAAMAPKPLSECFQLPIDGFVPGRRYSARHHSPSGKESRERLDGVDVARTAEALAQALERPRTDAVMCDETGQHPGMVVLQLILRRLPDIDHGLAGEMFSGDLVHRPSPCPWSCSRRSSSLTAPPRAAVPPPVGPQSPVLSA